MNLNFFCLNDFTIVYLFISRYRPLFEMTNYYTVDQLKMANLHQYIALHNHLQWLIWSKWDKKIQCSNTLMRLIIISSLQKKETK